MDDWRSHADCRDHPPEAFFPFPGDRAGQQKAAAICRSCPVILQCREDGKGMSHGVFGGVYRWEGRPEGDPVPKPAPREERTTLGEMDRLRTAGLSERAIATVLGVKPESVARARQRKAAAAAA